MTVVINVPLQQRHGLDLLTIIKPVLHCLALVSSAPVENKRACYVVPVLPSLLSAKQDFIIKREDKAAPGSFIGPRPNAIKISVNVGRIV